MPLIEEVEDDAEPSWSAKSLAPILRELSARLALPEELLASFMGGNIRMLSHMCGCYSADRSAQEAMEIYHDHAHRTLGDIESKVSGSEWDMLDIEDQGKMLDGVVRLYGHEPFSSEPVRQTIDRESSSYVKSDH